MKSTTSEFCTVLLALLIAITMTGCQGMGNSSSTPTPGVVAVTLNQASVNVGVSGSMQFMATVTGSSNTAVAWTVVSVKGGNSTVGTISTAGLYTAPGSAGKHTVTATSAADTTKSAQASVAVGLISLSPASALLAPAGTQQFSATIQGFSNTAVTWSVDGVTGGNSTAGTITASGMYSAPAAAGTHSVTAASAADSSVTATATATIAAIIVSPTSATVAPAGTQQFTATLQGSSAATWSVDGVTGGNATAGLISASGLYTAPSQPGSHTVTATSVANPTESASAAVSVVTISISPTSGTLASSTTQQFTATVQGSTNAIVTWSVDGVAGGNSTAGTISSNGLYTAPISAGSHTVAAAYTADPAISATATLSVFAFTISPAAITVPPSGTQQFTAKITGLTPPTVTWTVDGIAGGNATIGTISASGLYSAPATTGAHNIVATSTADPSASVDAALTVINASQAAVLTYHNDDARDGAYQEELSLTTSNVKSTTFGKLLSYPVNGQIYAQPLYLPQVTINGAKHDVVYVGTQNNYFYAFDADATASTPTTFWQLTPTTLGPPVFKGDLGGPYPNIGVLSTPVIDATTDTIYFVVHSSNTGPNGTPFFLYAVNALTGAVINHVAINATDTDSGDVMETSCYQRMGLALNPVTNWIYMAFGSCSHGWVLAYDKASLQQKAVFDDTAGQNPGGGGFWAGGGAPAIDDTTGNVFLMSGVDSGDEGDAQILYNDSFLNLNPTTLSIQSFFAPDNNLALAKADADLGSGAPIIVPGNSTYSQEIVGGGKDGNVFVLNPTNMGGYSGSSNDVLQNIHTGVDQYDNIFSTPVYWNGSIYYHPAQDVLRAFSWTAGAAAGAQLSSSDTSQASAVYNSTSHGATASLSSNGAINGIIWDIDNSGYVDTGNGTVPCVLHAYDATNVANELYNSSQAGSRDTAGFALKFTVPTIANGRVFVPTANELDIYGLLP